MSIQKHVTSLIAEGESHKPVSLLALTAHSATPEDEPAEESDFKVIGSLLQILGRRLED